MTFAETEFSELDFGDERRERRFRLMVERMLASPSSSLASAMRGWPEVQGAYRLLNNKAVTLEKIIEAHRAPLLERARGHGTILVVQDTTELDYTDKAKLEGAGPLNTEKRRGFYAHTQYCLSEDRLPLGIWDTQLDARESLCDDKAKKAKLPIEQKETYRWLKGYDSACELAGKLPDAQVVSVGDREYDICDIFQARHWRMAEGLPAAHWLCRAKQDRCLDPAVHRGEGAEGGPMRLMEAAAAAPVVGEIRFTVKRKKQFRKKQGNRRATLRGAREVRQRVRIREVTLRPPHGRRSALSPQTVHVIAAEEIDPPEGEEPINWVLTTSLPAGTFEQAQRVLRLYLARWDIEVFHRTLKTGCRVEQLQLKTAGALLPCFALFAIVAWRILYLAHLGRQCPDLPCSVVFEEFEWKAALAVVRKNRGRGEPKEPTLAEMLQIVACLGGHLGRKGDSPPGAQPIWIGLSRIRDFAIAWEAFESTAS